MLFASLIVLTACTSVTASINNADRSVQTIEKDIIPFSGPDNTAIVQETFEKGTRVKSILQM
jgi:hypothetical protein